MIGPSCRLTEHACIADHILEHRGETEKSVVLINATSVKNFSLMVLAETALHTAGKVTTAGDVSPTSVVIGNGS